MKDRVFEHLLHAGKTLIQLLPALAGQRVRIFQNCLGSFLAFTRQRTQLQKAKGCTGSLDAMQVAV